MSRSSHERVALARWILPAGLVCWAALAGCGPTKSTALIMDADVELQAAKTADAAKLAPYEYARAEVYLHKAREEQGYADYEVAISLAEKALDSARQAKKKAMGAKAEGAIPEAKGVAASNEGIDR